VRASAKLERGRHSNQVRCEELGRATQEPWSVRIGKGKDLIY